MDSQFTNVKDLVQSALVNVADDEVQNICKQFEGTLV